MKRLEINYTHEEQDEQRYEREREHWIEAAADLNADPPKCKEHQPTVAKHFSDERGKWVCDVCLKDSDKNQMRLLRVEDEA